MSEVSIIDKHMTVKTWGPDYQVDQMYTVSIHGRDLLGVIVNQNGEAVVGTWDTDGTWRKVEL